MYTVCMKWSTLHAPPCILQRAFLAPPIDECQCAEILTCRLCRATASGTWTGPGNVDLRRWLPLLQHSRRFSDTLHTVYTYTLANFTTGWSKNKPLL